MLALRLNLNIDLRAGRKMDVVSFPISVLITVKGVYIGT